MSMAKYVVEKRLSKSPERAHEVSQIIQWNAYQCSSYIIDLYTYHTLVYA